MSLSKISDIHSLLTNKIYPNLNSDLFYLDIQYNKHPSNNNFSYNLEKYGYSGYYFDPKWKDKNINRQVINVKLNVDTDLSSIFRLYNVPRFINYLYLNYLDNLMVIKKIPFSIYTIGFIQIKRCKNQQKIRKKLNFYNLFHQNKNYDFYLLKKSIPPFFVGQKIYGKFKIIKFLKAGVDSVGVFLVRDNSNNRRVMKFFKKQMDYESELRALKLLSTWEYSPNLVYHDDTIKVIIMQYCGNDIRKKKPAIKNNVIKKVQSLTKILKKKYNFYHNDVRFKNICMNNKKIYLIDWSRSSNIDVEKNHDKIL